MGIMITDPVTNLTDTIVHITDVGSFVDVKNAVANIVAPNMWQIHHVMNPAEGSDIWDTTLQKYCESVESCIDDNGHINIT